MVRIALDIDGTLGYRNREQYLRTCNETLKLKIPAEHLQGISLQTFSQLPEVLAYKDRVGEVHYAKAMGWIDYHPEVLRAMHPLPGAREGVRRLAAVGSVTYATARYTAQSEERSQQMRQATYEWLVTHAFLNPAGIFFCDGLTGKLQQLAHTIACDPEPTILIDDQYDRLLQRFTLLDETLIPCVKEFFVLVAFGARTVPENAPISVIALPSWKEEAVHGLMESMTHLITRE